LSPCRIVAARSRTAPQWCIEPALPWTASVSEYQRQADGLFARLQAGEEAAQWRVKWVHPRFHDKNVADVKNATLDLDDARQVTAGEYHLEDWPALGRFADAAAHDEGVRRFERTVEAVIDGDSTALAEALRADPDLARARSVRRHHATLLHYTAANGVENHRQRTPPNAVAIATLLLDAGADVDALADMYGHKCTTLSMLVSSTPPYDAGVQGELASLLVDRGARLVGPGSKWQSAAQTALIFGFVDTAGMLAQRGGGITDVVTAAGLGNAAAAASLLPTAPDVERHQAFALAVQYGHVDVVRLLLDAGEDPNRFNPEEFHSHGTPLHHAAAGNHLDVVRLLVERGARVEVRDRIYEATPLGWAEHMNCPDVANYLRAATLAR
jgi:ankyrin repeat protein